MLLQYCEILIKNPKIMKKQLLFLTLFISAISFAQTVGEAFSVDDIDYTITSIGPNEVEVSGSTLATLNIPSSVMGGTGSLTYAVTAIGANAFQSNTTITSVTLPNSITTLGGSAFSGCSNLIGTFDLSGVNIGSYCFFNCGGVTSVTVDNSTVFNTAALRGTGVTSFTIPDNWTTLPQQMLRDCLSIEQIIIPSAVTTFGTAAFRGCTNLTKMQIDGTSVISLDNTNAIESLPASCILYVPDTATETAYEADATWTTYFDTTRIVVGTLNTKDFSTLDVRFYPNPTNGVVTIENAKQENISTSVYSLTGRKLLDTKESQVDISDLASGIYLFKIESESGSAVKRVVKK